MHSHFFGKTFGEGNIRSYFFYQYFEFVISVVYVIFILHQIAAKNTLTSSDTMLQFIEMHVRMNPMLLITIIFAYVWIAKCVDKFFFSLCAFSRGSTLNEYANIWNYKYQFETMSFSKVTSLFDNTSTTYFLYKNKSVSLCQMICNLIKFVCSCRRSKTRQQRPKKDQFIEL